MAPPLAEVVVEELAVEAATGREAVCLAGGGVSFFLDLLLPAPMAKQPTAVQLLDAQEGQQQASSTVGAGSNTRGREGLQSSGRLARSICAVSLLSLH